MQKSTEVIPERINALAFTYLFGVPNSPVKGLIN